jgi:hypothetical protein
MSLKKLWAMIISLELVTKIIIMFPLKLSKILFKTHQMIFWLLMRISHYKDQIHSKAILMHIQISTALKRTNLLMGWNLVPK